MHTVKVFQIGFGRTGTKSVAAGLRQCGLRVLDFRHERLNRARLIRLWAQGHIDDLMDLAARYDVVEDHPWPLMFRELEAAHPQAKFLYSTRSAASWLESIINHTATRGPSEGKLHIFGADTPVGHEAAYVERFLAHRDEVREHFAGAPSFLEFDVTQPGAEESIANFLGLDEFRLPQLNRSRPERGAA